jgi:hypothetical protein
MFTVLSVVTLSTAVRKDKSGRAERSCLVVGWFVSPRTFPNSRLELVARMPTFPPLPHEQREWRVNTSCHYFHWLVRKRHTYR